jgi:uncharacterized protein (DUF362 family)
LARQNIAGLASHLDQAKDKAVKMRKVTVMVDRLAGSREGLRAQLVNTAQKIGLDTDTRSARAILIKPNLTYPIYKPGVTTRMEFIREVVVTLIEFNKDVKIYIGEGEGGYNSFSMDEAFKTMGFFELAREFSQVEIINLSKVAAKKVTLPTLRGNYEIDLPEIFFEEIDFSISCPVPKVHDLAQISLSYKNLWGCLPDIMRLKNHYMFNYLISRVADTLKFKYAFLDGKYGLNNSGPIVGDAIELNWFTGANSLGAFDLIVSQMMGFEWTKIGYLKVADKYGYLPKKEHIELIGDSKSLKSKFSLRRGFWQYPALIAFQSRYLTQFVYLSNYSKLLHDIMYLFRKRPIEH